MEYVFIILGILGIGVGWYLYRRHKLYYHFGLVEKGRLYRSGKLPQRGLEMICQRYGIKTIVNLSGHRNFEGKQWLADHKEYCARNNIALVQIPMLTSEPPNAEQIKQFIDICDDGDNYPVLVHCMQGVLRTGMMVAVYQKRYMKMANADIFQKLPSFGHDFESERYVAFREFVMEFEIDGFDRGGLDI
ncbi:MAG: dual specificity protein phosphatase family protein [Phycisphaerae bacterium]|nr:dual specificity protein phosphatase family protein [Phycisphaerae bacterium]